jgi:antirestriction protein ArdC
MATNTEKPDRLDVHQAITNTIVAAIEAGAGAFQMPWHRSSGSTMRPINITTGKAYQGINTLNLWIASEIHGYTAPVWGTFKQWLDNKTPVRKGEKATLGVVYKDLTTTSADDATGEETEQRRLMAKAFWLFNAAQVDGYSPPPAETFTPVTVDPIETADALLIASGARITETGDRAFYRPSTDEIVLPERARFKGSATMTPTEAFYATALHELTHWSGGKARLDRDLSGRFATNAYAMEELIAELGAAYLCADLGVTPIARPDHAQYLASWLTVLKGDKKAIFTAASAAQKAAAYLLDFKPHDPQPDRPGPSIDAGDNPERAP